MSIRSEVAAAARTAVATLPVELVDDAEEAIDAAATAWLHSTTGSLDGAVADVHHGFETAKDSIHVLRQLLDQLPRRVEAWITGLGSAALPDQPGPVASSQVAPAAAAREQLAERVRGELPPTVVPGTGAKTHGRWTADGQTIAPIVSGRDADATLADRLLAERGLPRKTTRAADVELKLAARMANGGPRHVTVVINNQVCRGPYGCDTLVPILLPAGATLTVLGNNGFRKTYTGGATPWWS